MKKKKKADTHSPDQSASLSLMRKYKSPMTREEFLKMNYMGSVPAEIPPEDEADFPPEFQLNPDPDDEESEE